MPSKRGLPEALSERLTRQFGASALDAMVAAMRVNRLPTLRINTLKTDDHALMRILREEGIAFERVQGIPHALTIKNRSDKELLAHPIALEGKIYLQGTASMAPPLVLDPKPGESVLDLCAAPGSKTSQMAAMMENKGMFVAYEQDEVRFQKLLNTVAIQGASVVETLRGDAAKAGETYPARFDKVLADVPCSAEGRISLADARSYGYWSEKNIREHAKMQRRLLRSAVTALKPGGILVYSTCTLAPEENEEMIGWILQEYPGLVSEAFDIPLRDTRSAAHKTKYVLPNREHEGLFVAKLRKREPGGAGFGFAG